MTSNSVLLLWTAFFCLQAPAVHAQTSPGNETAPPTVPQTDIRRPGTLSDKLNESGGVIRPMENVDPGMRKSAPVEHPNSTPVIPPPGTDGRPGAVPK